MRYAFEEFELDVARQELVHDGLVRRLPQRLFNSLYLLISNSDRAISKDEFVEKVWHGRAVTDDSISAAIRDLRRLLGDDGTAQCMIRTQHGFGFRWVAETKLGKDSSSVALVRGAGRPEEPTSDVQDAEDGRPSIAVLPFRDFGPDGETGLLGDAIPAELIAEMARMRWLRVMARGSSFRFREADPDPGVVGQMLNVRYALTGLIERCSRDLAVSLELARTMDGSVIWTETLNAPIDDVHDMRRQIISRVVSALDLCVTAEEAKRALARPPENLDAWGEFHIGLRHLYRYNLKDMALARSHFEAALSKERDFARAHAGLSFIAFQQAFMHYGQDRGAAVAQSLDHGERGLSLDPLDPFCNYCLARAFWAEGDLDRAKEWSRRSFEISPSYAHGHYLYSMMDLYSGGTSTALGESSVALGLSPVDPLSYGMLATHASALIGCGDLEAAATWAERAASRPEAHYLIHMIAAAANDLAGNAERAAFWADRARRRRPDAGSMDFFEAFHYRDCETRSGLSRAFRRLGF